MPCGPLICDDSGEFDPQRDDIVRDDDPSDEDVAAYGDDAPDTMPCPHCKQEISEESERCPHCGEWITSSPDRGVGTPIAIAGAVMVLLILGFTLVRWGT